MKRWWFFLKLKFENSNVQRQRLPSSYIYAFCRFVWHWQWIILADHRRKRRSRLHTRRTSVTRNDNETRFIRPDSGRHVERFPGARRYHLPFRKTGVCSTKIEIVPCDRNTHLTAATAVFRRSRYMFSKTVFGGHCRSGTRTLPMNVIVANAHQTCNGHQSRDF